MPLDWSRVVLLPTDERCVPHEHPACNVRELRDAFAEAKAARIESLTVSDGDPSRSEAHARALLAGFERPVDIVVLGMGLLQMNRDRIVQPGLNALRAQDTLKLVAIAASDGIDVVDVASVLSFKRRDDFF